MALHRGTPQRQCTELYSTEVLHGGTTVVLYASTLWTHSVAVLHGVTLRDSYDGCNAGRPSVSYVASPLLSI